MEVGIRELKANLSRYVSRASAGEAIVVTDRGVPTCVLQPLPGRVHLDRGIDEGWVTPPSRSGLEPVPRQRAERNVRDVLDEDRDR
jgi:prevent-host-death family protein